MLKNALSCGKDSHNDMHNCEYKPYENDFLIHMFCTYELSLIKNSYGQCTIFMWLIFT